VHVSQLADGYVRNVADVVAVGATVRVKVMSVDAGSGRLALTMKGVEGNPKPAASSPSAGGQRGAGGGGGGRGAGGRGQGQRGGARGSSSAADAEADAPDELEANEAFVEGITLRFDDPAAEQAAPMGEADVDALEMLPASGAAALAVNDLVEGVVKEVQDFGVIVEFAGPDGAAAQGLLHVSEMAAPAAKLPQSSEGANNAEAGGEAEFAGLEYEDVGGVDDPKKYYAPGDKVRAFVLDVAEAGGRAELTQFVYDEADGQLLARAGLLNADDDGDRLLERVARAAGGEAELPVAAPAGGRGRGRFQQEEEAISEDVGELSAALPSDAAEAALFYGQAASYPDRAVAGLVGGRAAAPLAPGALPDRPLRAVKDVGLMTPQVGQAEVGDGGEESELVDFWTLDYAPADARLMRKGALRKLGARLEKASEEQGGGWSVQPVEGAEEVNVSFSTDFVLLRGLVVALLAACSFSFFRSPLTRTPPPPQKTNPFPKTTALGLLRAAQPRRRRRRRRHRRRPARRRRGPGRGRAAGAGHAPPGRRIRDRHW
jgi:predicted RNA-binding protein with RPS1 domain